MKFHIDYDFDNWNEYIRKERSNKYWASTIKKKELDIVRYSTIGLKYNGNYPIKITFEKYFKDKRQDLDNIRVKGILDGLVKCGIIKNDNLNCIQEIAFKPIFNDEKVGIDIIIEEMGKWKN